MSEDARNAFAWAGGVVLLFILPQYVVGLVILYGQGEPLTGWAGQ